MGLSPAEDTTLARLLDHKVSEGAEACSPVQPAEKALGYPQEVCIDMMRNSQKLEHRIFSSDVRNISSLWGLETGKEGVDEL